MHADLSLPKRASDVPELARRAQRLGLDGLWLGETRSDPFLGLALAAQATEQIRLGTGVAIAFARTPMTLAYTAYELAGLSRGRFVLGLGSQVEAHVRRRFSMPWSAPAARMREFVLALRAIWDTWHAGAKLDFRGEHYRHDLMTPYFSPERHESGPPPVVLAGVGARMTEVAGEVCDGFLFHPFTTKRYLREITLPALARARARAGQTPDGLRGCGPVLRRLPVPPVHDQALPARDPPARAGARPRARGQDARRLPRVRPAVREPGARRARARGRREGEPPAVRVLGVDAGLPAGARAARLGRAADRAGAHGARGPLERAGRCGRSRGVPRLRVHRAARKARRRADRALRRSDRRRDLRLDASGGARAARAGRAGAARCGREAAMILRRDRRGAVEILTLNRPEARNAFNP